MHHIKLLKALIQGKSPNQTQEQPQPKECSYWPPQKNSTRYIGNSPSIQSLADREIDTKHALQTYLQDHQAHEKLALKLQSTAANEATQGSKEDAKGMQVQSL